MGYSVGHVMSNIIKLDGTTLTDSTMMLPHVISNQTPADNLIASGMVIFPEQVSSVILIGLDNNTSPTNPSIIEVDAKLFSTMINESGCSTGCPDEYPSSNLFYSDAYPINTKEHADKTTVNPENIQLAGINMLLSDFVKLNLNVFDTSNNFQKVISKSGSTVDFASYDTMKNYMTIRESDIIGINDKPTNDILLNGVSSAAILLHTIDVIDELRIRWGYRTPDESRPYSPYNWLKLSIDGLPSSQCRLFRIMYLPTFDAFIHAGVISNPSIANDQFVKSSNAITRMIKTMQQPSVKTSLGNPMNNEANEAYSWIQASSLTKNDVLICGQSIYSKDYSYKMVLNNTGSPHIYKFPITNSNMSSYFVKLQPIKDLVPYDVNNFIQCILCLQSDNNIVVYQNPTIKYTINKNVLPAVSITGGTAVKVLNLSVNPIMKQVPLYSILISPGGGFIVATSLTNALNKYGKIIHATDDTIDKQETSYPLNDDCLNFWYDQQNIKDGKDILYDGITNDFNSEKTYCITSPIVKPITKNINGGVEFETIVFAQYPDNQQPYKSYDIIHNILNGDFGKVLSKAQIDVNSLEYSNFMDTTLSYCMRGARLFGDPTCNVDFEKQDTVPKMMNVVYTNPIDSSKISLYDIISERAKFICKTDPEPAYTSECDKLDASLKKWCDENTSDPNYKKYCVQPEEQKHESSMSSTTIIIIVVIVGLLLLSGLGYVLFKYFGKSNTHRMDRFRNTMRYARDRMKRMI